MNPPPLRSLYLNDSKKKKNNLESEILNDSRALARGARNLPLLQGSTASLVQNILSGKDGNWVLYICMNILYQVQDFTGKS